MSKYQTPRRGHFKEVIRPPADSASLAAENAELKARVAALEAQLDAIRQDRADYMRNWLRCS